MRQFRTVLFWIHLTAGVLAGVVVVIMSVTGVLLMYQRQIQAWADRGDWRPPASSTVKLTVEQTYAALRRAEPNAVPTTITIRSAPDDLSTAVMTGARTGSVLVDPYTGDIVPAGRRSASIRAFFASVTSWHRYLATVGESRTTGRAVTGASNLAFLFIVLSGIYLWWPRTLRWSVFRAVLWFRGGLPGKARDFNWHNVLGVWSAVPLAVVVASGVVISYPWASNLVYRAAGETPPASQGRGGGPGGGGGTQAGTPGRQGGGGGRPEAGPPSERPVANLDRLVLAAGQIQPAWRSIAVPIPVDPKAPVALSVDTGDGGQPQRRGTLTFDRETGSVLRREMFADQSQGRRWRSILRFAHTGEVLGLFGQTVAGVVSAASVVLAYTGIALACRRLTAWLKRRRRQDELPTPDAETRVA